MFVKKLQDVPFADLHGYDKVEKQIVIGPDDGSDEIVMRYFTLAQDGSSPYHSHDWPHLVRIEQGEGILVDKDNAASPVTDCTLHRSFLYCHPCSTLGASASCLLPEDIV